MAENPLIVALDLPDRRSAIGMAERLRDHVSLFKVGMELFYSEGPSIVRDLNSMGVGVFLDLKLHDIPNTVGSAMRQISRLGPAMVTVHAAGGSEMLRNAVTAVEENVAVGAGGPVILAVTLLTSIDERALREDLLSSESPLDYVIAMARLSKAAGVGGVVASAQEAQRIRRECGDELIIVTPGIRPSWYGHGDQRRVTTPSAAVSAGADYIVVGRPVTQSDDPARAAARILEEISEGKATNLDNNKGVDSSERVGRAPVV